MEMAVDPVYNRGESWRVPVLAKKEPKARFRAWDILNRNRKEVVMLRWALGFFIVALVAAVLGFSGIAVAAAGIAKILFFIFLVLFLVSLIGHLLRRT
jgi:uncharacterized membrane protein YtjA (UPF0391 family)